MQQSAVWRFRLNLGEPPVLILNIVYHAIAGWISFLGAFWDVRRRIREWALIRLYGGHPSLILGFQYSCISLLGSLVGGCVSILAKLFRSATKAGRSLIMVSNDP